MKTFSAKPADIKREWHLIDAADKTLGRLATDVARLLMGKHKPIFSPNQDTGDYVVIINAAKVKTTGGKEEKKLYYRHSGYPGGLKTIWLGKMMETHPTRAVEHAVKGMLPHTRLGAQMLRKLRVYAGEDQPHVAQAKAAPAQEAK
ncbi:MAG: 50S ribosomal protein L13 [Chloroflexota bacterium]